MQIRSLTIFVLSILIFHASYSQCCGGGSGSPVAGGTSQGVLGERQMEISSNYQYIYSTNFLTKDTPAGDSIQVFSGSGLKGFSSQYNYFRLGYGLTRYFTMSLESGYYFDKRQMRSDSITEASSGIGDLIIFPRYNIYNHSKEDKTTEVTLGMGWKIPLGKYNDSLMQIDPFANDTFYITLPPSVQPATGSHDFIFYAFLYRRYPLKNFRVFANAMYVKKGWTPLGEKFGDYATVGLFAGKTMLKTLSITLQLKGEWMNKTEILLYAIPNYDPEATGNKKVSIIPQISYNYKKITFYALSEFPIYQYLNKTQIASQYQFSAGISYRFYVLPKSIIPKSGEIIYECPLKCERRTNTEPGKCNVCGMDLIKKK